MPSPFPSSSPRDVHLDPVYTPITLFTLHRGPSPRDPPPPPPPPPEPSERSMGTHYSQHRSQSFQGFLLNELSMTISASPRRPPGVPLLTGRVDVKRRIPSGSLSARPTETDPGSEVKHGVTTPGAPSTGTLYGNRLPADDIWFSRRHFAFIGKSGRWPRASNWRHECVHL